MMIRANTKFDGKRPDGEQRYREVRWVKDEVPKGASTDDILGVLK